MTIRTQEGFALEDGTLSSPAAALGAEHQLLRRQLERAVRMTCPRWLAEDAEDLVQDAFIRLLKSGRLTDPDLSPAYLKKVAFSAVVDEIRRRRRQTQDQARDDNADLESIADPSPSGPAREELGHAIEASLARLVPDRKRAVTLYLLGYSGAETARLLDCTAKRAENLTYRGLGQLRELLKDLGFTP